MITKRGPGRPKLPRGERTIQMALRLSPLAAAKLIEHAKRLKTSRAKLASKIIAAQVFK